MARIAQFLLCVSAAVSAADVPQLRGRQRAPPADALEDCDVCQHDPYTGYNHEQSGESSGWQEEEAIQGVNAWWLCAEKCSTKSGCDGWTFAYKGDGPPYKCFLKSGTKPRSRWRTDYIAISGFPLANATALQRSDTAGMEDADAAGVEESDEVAQLQTRKPSMTASYTSESHPAVGFEAAENVSLQQAPMSVCKPGCEQKCKKLLTHDYSTFRCHDNLGKGCVCVAKARGPVTVPGASTLAGCMCEH